MAANLAKNELKNLNNSVLVEIIAKNKNSKNSFANVISKNNQLILQVIKKLDKNTLGKIIGKDRMLNIVIADKNMLKEAKNRALTPKERKEREEAKELRYKKNRARRQDIGGYKTDENLFYSKQPGNKNISNGTVTF